MDLTINEFYKKYKDEGRIEFITFHPSYSYEEFVEGLTVDVKAEGVANEQPKYVLKSGIFKTFCKNALGAALGKTLEEIQKCSWGEIF